MNFYVRSSTELETYMVAAERIKEYADVETEVGTNYFWCICLIKLGIVIEFILLHCSVNTFIIKRGPISVHYIEKYVSCKHYSTCWLN